MFEHSKQGAVDLVQSQLPLTEERVAAAESFFERLTESGQPRIVFGMDGIALIDSDGLELLMDVQDRCTSRGGELKLLKPGPLVREILRITEVEQRFEIYQDAVNAIGSFSR